MLEALSSLGASSPHKLFGLLLKSDANSSSEPLGAIIYELHAAGHGAAADALLAHVERLRATALAEPERALRARRSRHAARAYF